MKRRFGIVCCFFIVTTQALGGAYEDGITAYGQGRFKTAFDLWHSLAEQGNAPAQYNLGVLFEQGQGVGQDYAAAGRWYLKAAEQGDAQAQYSVAVLYEKGIGLPLDLEQARYWYEKVLANPRANRGSSEPKRQAQERLANLSSVPNAQIEAVIDYEGGRFVIRRSPLGICVVALQGLVTQDATFKLEDAGKKAAAIGCNKPWTMLLESPGGTLFDGISLGQELRSQGLQTVARYECASACAMIFLGGTERVLWGSRARIGLHQAALLRGQDKRCDQSMNSPGVLRMRAYLRFAIPAEADQVLQLIMKTSCDSIEWVSGQRAIELGVATKLESEGVDVFGPKERRQPKM